MSRAEGIVTRAEHHADSSVAKVKSEKEQIAWILKRRNCKEWSITAKGLARATGWKPDEEHNGIEPTTVRDCIREIRRERNLPIVSYNRGYYLIGNVAELERFIEKKRETISTHEQTIEDQVRAFNSMRYDDE